MLLQATPGSSSVVCLLQNPEPNYPRQLCIGRRVNGLFVLRLRVPGLLRLRNYDKRSLHISEPLGRAPDYIDSANHLVPDGADRSLEEISWRSAATSLCCALVTGGWCLLRTLSGAIRVRTTVWDCALWLTCLTFPCWQEVAPEHGTGLDEGCNQKKMISLSLWAPSLSLSLGGGWCLPPLWLHLFSNYQLDGASLCLCCLIYVHHTITSTVSQSNLPLKSKFKVTDYFSSTVFYQTTESLWCFSQPLITLSPANDRNIILSCRHEWPGKHFLSHVI